VSSIAAVINISLRRAKDAKIDSSCGDPPPRSSRIASAAGAIAYATRLRNANSASVIVQPPARTVRREAHYARIESLDTHDRGFKEQVELARDFAFLPQETNVGCSGDRP
jgi:hypothetical protein